MKIRELLEELSYFGLDLPVFVPSFDGFTPLNVVRTANVIIVGQDAFGEDVLDEGGGEHNAVLLEFDWEKLE